MYKDGKFVDSDYFNTITKFYRYIKSLPDFKQTLTVDQSNRISGENKKNKKRINIYDSFLKGVLEGLKTSLTVFPNLLAMIFADSLTNYDTLWKIRPQTYVWGHILIVVCALYGILILKPKLEKRDLIYSLSFVGGMSIIAITCNSAFRAIFNWEPNYFYLYNYKGTPLKFLYNAFPTSTYGWFSINWFYTITLFLFFVGAFIGLYYLSKYINSLVEKTQNK